MKTEGLIELLFEAICQLARANVLTGYWDNKRNELRLAYDDEEWGFLTDEKHFNSLRDHYCEDIFHTERMSRVNCERRAKYRIILDTTLRKLIQIKML